VYLARYKNALNSDNARLKVAATWGQPTAQAVQRIRDRQAVPGKTKTPR